MNLKLVFLNFIFFSSFKRFSLFLIFRWNVHPLSVFKDKKNGYLSHLLLLCIQFFSTRVKIFFLEILCLDQTSFFFLRAFLLRRFIIGGKESRVIFLFIKSLLGTDQKLGFLETYFLSWNNCHFYISISIISSHYHEKKASKCVHVSIPVRHLSLQLY